METESTSMVGRWDKLTAESIHFGQRTYHTCITEIICIFATRETGARCWFHTDNLVLSLSAQDLSEERRRKTAKVGPATGTANQNIRFYTIFVKSLLGLQTDNGLVKENLI